MKYRAGTKLQYQYCKGDILFEITNSSADINCTYCSNQLFHVWLDSTSINTYLNGNNNDHNKRYGIARSKSGSWIFCRAQRDYTSKNEIKSLSNKQRYCMVYLIDDPLPWSDTDIDYHNNNNYGNNGYFIAAVVNMSCISTICMR